MSHNKKYLTEVLIITSFTNPYNLIDQLYWYLFILKFEHAVIIINNDNLKNIEKIKDIILKFNLNATIVHKPGKISQSELYTQYVNTSQSWWVLPIDDDEFLYISDKYDNNINKLILYNEQLNKQFKYSFTWLMMFSQNILNESNLQDSYIKLYDHAFITPRFADLDLNCVKTIVNTSIKHYYPSDTVKKNNKNITYADLNITSPYNTLNITYDHMGTVHNPISKINNEYVHSKNISNNLTNIGYIAYKLPELTDDALLLHFKYRSLSEWQSKIAMQARFIDISNNYYNIFNNDTFFLYYAQCKNFIQFNNPYNLYKNFDTNIKQIKGYYDK